MESSEDNSIQQLLEQADELWKNGQKEESIKMYNQITYKDTNPFVFYKLAEKLYDINKHSTARNTLLKALTYLDQANIEKVNQNKLKTKVLFLLGKIENEHVRDKKSASEYFKQAIEIADKDIVDHIKKQLESLNLDQEETPDEEEQIDQKRFEEAQIVQELLRNMDKQVRPGSKWFIISMKWIDAWQKFVYFDKLSSERTRIKPEDRKNPGPITNKDILLDLSPKMYLLEKQVTKLWQNVQMKPDLKEGENYMIVDEKIWEFLYLRYKAEQKEIIERQAIMVNEETGDSIVETYLRKIMVFPIPNNILKFEVPRSVLISRRETVSDLFKKIQRGYNNRLFELQERGVMISKLRLWKSMTNNIEDIKEIARKQMHYTSVKFDGQCLNASEGDNNKYVDELDLAEDDIIVTEEVNKKGQFVLQPQSLASNEERKVFEQTPQVIVASSQLQDFIDKDLNQVMAPSSRRGVCGLQNLGNTCFMNSGLQCLSNTIELSKYFCFGLYKKDINPKNPLGMGGKLASAYAELIREMWIGTSGRTAPHELKKVVGKRVTKFSGFGQQDSCELINYVLDLMHEDLNRVIQKPYVEMKDSDGRPDEIVSQEHWDAFLARNQSIIVDLMYGQLKSTVQCLECYNISITFDPFLTIALPIARPFKLTVIYVPYDMFTKSSDGKTMRNSDLGLQIALNKDSKISDLQAKVAEIVGNKTSKFLTANFNVRRDGQLSSKFRDDASCQDIDQSSEDTLIYELRWPTDDQEYKLVEFIFMKQVKSGKNILGEHYNRTLPRIEFVNLDMTILDIKKMIFQKIKYVFKEDSAVFKSDEELNKNLLIQLFDNLPYQQESKYSRRKAACEFCKEKHSSNYTCDMKINGVSANTDEGSNSIKLRDIVGRMEHKRELILGVIFRENCGAMMKYLDPEIDNSHIKDMNKKEKESISLDSCFKAFSREELLTGADQWYCNKCKEQRDIHKTLQLYRLPRILIIQLKRFQSKRSNSKAGGFFNLAYAQIMSQEKVGDFVDFPVEALDVRPYVEYLKDSPDPVYYDLYAVSNHYGSLNGGHYTAYGYNSLLGKWYDFNDSSVSSTSINEVVSNGAYLLFYRKRDNKQ